MNIHTHKKSINYNYNVYIYVHRWYISNFADSVDLLCVVDKDVSMYIDNI